MKIRLRADIRAAMKDGRQDETKLFRALVAAIDNAEAPPARQESSTPVQFQSGAAEVERLVLSRSDVAQVLQAAISEREHAALEFERLGRMDHAGSLRTEAHLAKRYVE